MNNADFQTALKITLKNEGGYSDNPNDSGGETNYGITKSMAVLNGYTGPMKSIPMSTVELIYLKYYWLPLQCAMMISQNLANNVFDSGVNQGPGTSAKILQKSLNLMEENLNVDGVIGPKTLQAANNLTNQGKENELISNFSDIRKGYYRLLVKEFPKNQEFLNGWLARC